MGWEVERQNGLESITATNFSDGRAQFLKVADELRTRTDVAVGRARIW